jgi:hypothetical protein
MEVSRFHDILGRLLDRDPRFLIWLGNVESRWSEPRISNISIDQPIYIAGLARSGSTVLLEILSAHGAVTTHKYRDFPLVHIPLWWNWFIERAGSGTANAVERAHRDGIRVTQDSPEAMEEILWMAFFKDCHNPSANNVPAAAENPEFEDFYRAHIRKLLLLRGGSRYVSKGNYNVARLQYIQAMFPDACFLIPVREPVMHVASLLKQHRLFCAAETEDPRVLNYMRRSGHFEFGLDRRPLNLGDGEIAAQIQVLWNEGEDIRGLARYWAYVYGYVADLLEGDEALARRTLLVRYEDFCDSPEEDLANIHAHCELEIDYRTIERQARSIAAPTYYRHGFSDAELAAIENETSAVKARIDRLALMRSASAGRRSRRQTVLRAGG